MKQALRSGVVIYDDLRLRSAADMFKWGTEEEEVLVHGS